MKSLPLWTGFDCFPLIWQVVIYPVLSSFIRHFFPTWSRSWWPSGRAFYSRLRASDTFSAALFSACSSCWIPCDWLAMLDKKTGEELRRIGAKCAERQRNEGRWSEALLFFLSAPRSADLTSRLRAAHVTSSRPVCLTFLKCRTAEKDAGVKTKIADTLAVYISFFMSPNKRKKQATWQRWRRRVSVAPWWIERENNKERIPNYYKQSITKDQFCLDQTHNLRMFYQRVCDCV